MRRSFVINVYVLKLQDAILHIFYTYYNNTIKNIHFVTFHTFYIYYKSLYIFLILCFLQSRL